MSRLSITTLLLPPLLALSGLASAADATGRWQTIDDDTGKVKSIVEITQTANGTLAGKVVEIVQSGHGPNPACTECKGADKDKPIKGLTILWNLKPGGANAWSGGTILDPANGKTYKSKALLSADGRQLDVSGCVAFICRAQVWKRP